MFVGVLVYGKETIHQGNHIIEGVAVVAGNDDIAISDFWIVTYDLYTLLFSFVFYKSLLFVPREFFLLRFFLIGFSLVHQ